MNLQENNFEMHPEQLAWTSKRQSETTDDGCGLVSQILQYILRVTLMDLLDYWLEV